jgi:short-subunit dehydrogenase
MKFELSNLLSRNVDKIKKINSKFELEVFVKCLILDNNLTKDKTSIIILKQLEKSKDFNSSQQVVWNALVSNSGAFLGKEITKKSWYKGTAIAGMECHSH